MIIASASIVDFSVIPRPNSNQVMCVQEPESFENGACKPGEMDQAPRNRWRESDTAEGEITVGEQAPDLTWANSDSVRIRRIYPEVVPEN